MIKYVLHPGYVTSRTDEDTHFITAPMLIQLYGVKADECVNADLAVPSSVVYAEPGEYIHLYPREDGNYERPND